MNITRLLLHFIDCRYKALLTQRQETPRVSEFLRLTNEQRATCANKGLSALIDSYDPIQILRSPTSLSGSIRPSHRLVLDATCLLAGGRVIDLPPIEVGNSGDGAEGALTPVLFSDSNRVRESDKLIACLFGLLVAEQTPRSVHRAKIIYGNAFDVRHVALRGKNGATRIAASAQHSLDAFLAFLRGDGALPKLHLNPHCEVCGFRQRCRQEAQQKNDISLLPGLSALEIEQLMAKGISTITQLAHTFQPKRYVRPGYEPRHHSQPLQALAIQQGTIFVRKKPTIPDTRIGVYLDVEGIPDIGRFYLIGAILENGNSRSPNQFWADCSESEGQMWQAFLKKIDTLPDDFVVFHYGAYDRTSIETMLERYGTCGFTRMRRLPEQMWDVYQAIRTNVFFPAYSNRIKDIAAGLGISWAGPITSGVQSIAWRKEWESTKEEKYKHNLLQYNREDCEALLAVVRCLRSLGEDRDESPIRVEQATNVDPTPSYGFGKSNFAVPGMREITKRAYFNYQQDRVFARTHRRVRLSAKRKKRKQRKLRINAVVSCAPPDACAVCGCRKLIVARKHSQKKCVKDLRFSGSGVKRWLTEYATLRWLCTKCGKTCYSPEYPTKKPYFGHGVASWIVHQHVGNRQSHVALMSNLNDLFGFDFSPGIAERAMRRLASEYAAAEASLLSTLRRGVVICADEAKVQVRGGTGYVWAFSGIQEVVYRFTETRDGQILESILDGFHGVVVSDFYGGYDSVVCQQQKCLVHLMRDINNDLLKEPFNEELKLLANQFSGLLKPIVDAIDKFGLKRRHLNRFVKPASRFQDWVLGQEFRTKPAQRYQKRFRKYRDRLFTFLRHDGVPWHNNIAENAIKLVASRRRFFGASYSAEGMRNYLLFLSLYQTLRRKGGSFLRFLLSEETDLSAFLGE